MMKITAFVFCCLASAAVAAAQAPSASPKSDKPAAGATAAVPASAPAVPPKGFTYDPENRRDPFVSVLRTGTDPEQPVVRRPGLAGLGVSEVSLKGTVDSHHGFVAILQAVDGKTYIVREGEKLLDATVASITQNTLTLLQAVNDPLPKGTQREVRKVLRQTDEAK